MTNIVCSRALRVLSFTRGAASCQMSTVSADSEPPKLSRGGSDGKVVRGEPPRVADLEDEGIASDEEDEVCNFSSFMLSSR